MIMNIMRLYKFYQVSTWNILFVSANMYHNKTQLMILRCRDTIYIQFDIILIEYWWVSCEFCCTNEIKNIREIKQISENHDYEPFSKDCFYNLHTCSAWAKYFICCLSWYKVCFDTKYSAIKCRKPFLDAQNYTNAAKYCVVSISIWLWI